MNFETLPDPKPLSWGVFCSAAEKAGCKIPLRKFYCARLARLFAKEEASRCQTPGSKHVVRKIQP